MLKRVDELRMKTRAKKSSGAFADNDDHLNEQSCRTFFFFYTKIKKFIFPKM
jgi:hypothetical protein